MMSRINLGRVILGGLAAGVIINAGDYLAQSTVATGFNERTRALGIEMGSGAITGFIAIGFLIGLIAVWLYAAIRPRYGPGVRTAATAGVVMWLLMGLIGWAYPLAMGLLTRSDYFMLAAWSLVELVLATVVGAWIYREDGAMATTI